MSALLPERKINAAHCLLGGGGCLSLTAKQNSKPPKLYELRNEAINRKNPCVRTNVRYALEKLPLLVRLIHRRDIFSLRSNTFLYD